MAQGTLSYDGSWGSSLGKTSDGKQDKSVLMHSPPAIVLRTLMKNMPKFSSDMADHNINNLLHTHILGLHLQRSHHLIQLAAERVSFQHSSLPRPSRERLVYLPAACSGVGDHT